MSSSPSRTRPPCGLSSPVMTLKSVVFPAPFGPISPVTVPGSTNSQIIGQIQLTKFINKAGLLPVGSNQYQDTPSSGPPQDGIAAAEGFGTITQGSLEQANVDVVSEMSDLIAAQRAYEMNAKVISAADQMMQSTTALFR